MFVFFNLYSTNKHTPWPLIIVRLRTNEVVMDRVDDKECLQLSHTTTKKSSTQNHMGDDAGWPNWKRRIFDCQFVVSTRIQPLQRGTLNGSQSLQGTQYPFINGANALPPSLGIAGPQWIFLIFFAAFRWLAFPRFSDWFFSSFSGLKNPN